MNQDPLNRARHALITFEGKALSEGGVNSLAEGLDYLDEVLSNESARPNDNDKGTARALGETYAIKSKAIVSSLLQNRHATESELEIALRILDEFKAYDFGDADAVKKLRFETVRQLLDLYQEGCSTEERVNELRRFLDEKDT